MSATILEAVLGTVAVAAALSLIAFPVGRWSNRPALAHALWLIVLLKLLAPPLFTVPFHCLPAREEPLQSAVSFAPAEPKTLATETKAHLPAEPYPAAPLLEPSTMPAKLPAATTRRGGSPGEPTASQAMNWMPRWEAIVLGIWLSGTALSLGLSVNRVQRFGRLLRFATAAPQDLLIDVARIASQLDLRRSPRVRVVPGGITPLVWAVGPPTLYFPINLLQRISPEERLALIAHELAHLRRWDPVVRVIELAVVSIYWWCPLAWLARRELRRLEEEACDAEVLATLPGCSFSYASAILTALDSLAGAPIAPAFASGIGGLRSIRRRLEMILHAKQHARTSRRMQWLLAAIAIPFLIIGMRLDRLQAAVAAVELHVRKPLMEPVENQALAPEEATIEPVQFMASPVRLSDGLDKGSQPALAGVLSPDNKRLAVAVGAAVEIWDVANRQHIHSLAGHTDSINAIVYSPDGSRIATAANDTRLIIWDAATGRRLRILAGHDRWVLAVAFSPDSRTLASGGYDRTVRFWDVNTGKLLAAWGNHAGGVRSVAYSPDGGTLACGTATGEVRLWEVDRGEVIATRKRHQAAVCCLTFSPNGTRLASGSEDRTIQIWNPLDGRDVGRPIPVPDFATALRFTHHGRALFVGTEGGHLFHVNPLNGLACGYVGVVPGQQVSRREHGDAISFIAVSSDGKTLYSLSRDRQVLAWPAADSPQAPKLQFRGSHPLATVALSFDGKTLATAGQDGTIHLWDAQTARHLKTLTGHRGGVTAVVFAAGGRLVSTGADEQVRIWDLATDQVLRTLIQPTADLCIALAPDGCTLAISGRGMSGITLVDLSNAGHTQRIGVWAGEATALAFMPSSGRLATGHAQGQFRLWDLRTGEEAAHSTPSSGMIEGIAFDASGRTAAIVVNDPRIDDGPDETGPSYEVRFLNVLDASLLPGLRTLPHPGPITAAAFLADGTVITSARDGNLYFWDAHEGVVRRTIRGHIDAVCGMALAEDGTILFSAGGRTAKGWPLEKAEK